jgi:hypothetical protein
MQTKEAIQKYLETWGGDGHTIIIAESLVEMGFDREFVEKHAYDHKSGEDYKSKIFDKNGNVFASCYGVNSLGFSYAIAGDINADCTEAHSKMGRGFQAQCLAQAISIALKETV